PLPQHQRARGAAPRRDRLRVLARPSECVGRTEIDLLDDPRLAVHPRRAHPVEVVPPTLALAHDRRHAIRVIRLADGYLASAILLASSLGPIDGTYPLQGPQN